MTAELHTLILRKRLHSATINFTVSDGYCTPLPKHGVSHEISITCRFVRQHGHLITIKILREIRDYGAPAFTGMYRWIRRWLELYGVHDPNVTLADWQHLTLEDILTLAPMTREWLAELIPDGIVKNDLSWHRLTQNPHLAKCMVAWLQDQGVLHFHWRVHQRYAIPITDYLYSVTPYLYRGPEFPMHLFKDPVANTWLLAQDILGCNFHNLDTEFIIATARQYKWSIHDFMSRSGYTMDQLRRFLAARSGVQNTALQIKDRINMIIANSAATVAELLEAGASPYNIAIYGNLRPSPLGKSSIFVHERTYGLVPIHRSYAQLSSDEYRLLQSTGRGDDRDHLCHVTYGRERMNLGIFGVMEWLVTNASAAGAFALIVFMCDELLSLQ